MLSVSKVSAAHGAHYYGKSSDTAHSEWLGKGSKSLGLDGPVSSSDFKLAISGLGPNGIALSPTRHPNRVPAYDLTFSAPKSISIGGLHFDREELIEAHRSAVHSTLAEIEAEARTRRKMPDRSTQIIPTGNLTIATFEHHLSRALDPQLHTHSIVLNTTQHHHRWLAYDARPLFNSVKKWGRVYRDKLAQLVQSLGYEIRIVKDGFWELKGISGELIDKFSKRLKEIYAFVGVEASTKTKKYAALTTRKEKIEVGIPEIKQSWTIQAKAIKSKEQRELG